VRKFNQLAVPGLGGVWFAKQLYLATLGVAVAERLRAAGRSVTTIEAANAIEALACWCAFTSTSWEQDSRLRGRQKMLGKSDLTFAKLRQSSFYVTQPMRMATVEALVDLGFVEAGNQRFNSFRCTDTARDFIDAASVGCKPFGVSVEEYLVRQASNAATIGTTLPLVKALSPLQPIASDALVMLRDVLCKSSGSSVHSARRKNGLAWVSSVANGQKSNWTSRPTPIDADHWNDLHLGARFFATRDAAIDVLNAIETAIASTLRISIPESVRVPSVDRKLQALRQKSKEYLDDTTPDPTDGQMATNFCRECADPEPAQIMRSLVSRDARVMLLRGENILPGPAFRGGQDLEEDEDELQGPSEQNADRIPLPTGISPRVRNLYLLQLDLSGQLGAFLKPQDRAAAV